MSTNVPFRYRSPGNNSAADRARIQSAVGGRLNKRPPAAFSVSIISFHEQVLGWNAYLNRARGTAGVIRSYGMFERILADFAAAQVVGFDQPAAALFDAMRIMRIRISTLDLRIASIALSKKLTLLTRNLNHFRRVPGLVIEDWTK